MNTKMFKLLKSFSFFYYRELRDFYVLLVLCVREFHMSQFTFVVFFCGAFHSLQAHVILICQCFTEVLFSCTNDVVCGEAAECFFTQHYDQFHLFFSIISFVWLFLTRAFAVRSNYHPFGTVQQAGVCCIMLGLCKLLQTVTCCDLAQFSG